MSVLSEVTAYTGCSIDVECPALRKIPLRCIDDQVERPRLATGRHILLKLGAIVLESVEQQDRRTRGVATRVRSPPQTLINVNFRGLATQKRVVPIVAPLANLGSFS